MRHRRSAGLLPYRVVQGQVEVFLAHPGGPFWARKDDGAWSIPKGEYGEDEDPLGVARREFTEETGFAALPPYLDLGEIRQPGGKLVRAWAFAGDYDPAAAVSNSFSLEWPRGSGRMQEFPEVDRCDWFDVGMAAAKLLKGQIPFLDRLADHLRAQETHSAD